MDETIGIIAVLITGPLVGVEFGVAAFTNPLVGHLPDGAFRLVRSGGSKLLGSVMPFWYIGALVSLIGAAILGRGESRDWLIAASAVLMGVVVLLTVTVLVPINNRIGRWHTDAEVSRDLAGRWDRWHWVRVALVAGVLVLLVVGLV